MSGAGRPVRVVGAGLSGLAAAWALTERGCAVVIDETAPHAGGLLETRVTPEGLVEEAARGFLWSDRVAALFAAAGVTPVFADERAKRRYIFRDGRPRRWPLGPMETLSLVGHGGAALLTRQTAARPGESVATWGARVLGGAGTAWLLAPALQGIYASPLEALAAEAIFGGGRVRGKLATAPGGMKELFDGLLATLGRRGATIRLGSPVEALDPAQSTVVATPAPEAATLIAPFAPALAATLEAMPLTHLLSVTAFYAPQPSDIHGFGILFPRPTGFRALGVLFNADMFPGRSHLRSETWIYGAPDEQDIAALRADLTRQLAEDRTRLTGRTDEPVACYPTARVQRLPVYGPAVVRAKTELGTLPPWLRLSGNYLGQIGVSALVARAERTVAEWP